MKLNYSDGYVVAERKKETEGQLVVEVVDLSWIGVVTIPAVVALQVAHFQLVVMVEAEEVVASYVEGKRDY